MPKSIVATDTEIETLTFQVDATSTVTGLLAHLNVAYGETRVREELDLWAQLTPLMRTGFQTIYNTLKQRIQTNYLA